MRPAYAQCFMLFMILCCMVVWGKEVTYEESDEIFANPERGFIATRIVYSEGEPLQSNDLLSLRQESITMIVRVYYCEKFRNSALSSKQLELIDKDLKVTADAGLKLIVRIAYTDQDNGSDAPYDILVQHMEQLKTRFSQINAIAFVQAGFIGAYGEWHSSKNGLDTTERRKDVLFSLLNVVPDVIMVQIRTPGFKQDIFKTTTPISESDAYSGSNIARVGHHNDCFLTGGTDYGTYTQLPEQKEYISAEANFVPTGGETCPPQGNYQPTCDNARKEMTLLKWTYLNKDYYGKTIDGFKNEGCYDEFRARLGYRLVLRSAEFPETVEANSEVQIYLKMANVGFAPLYNSKVMSVIFKSGEIIERFELEYDIRNIKPAQTVEINETINLSYLAAGTYDLFLEIADNILINQDRIEYRVRLANKNMWNPSLNGVNNLSYQVVVTN